jgi:hypothetical protein
MDPVVSSLPASVRSGCDERHLWEGSGLSSVAGVAGRCWPVQPWMIVNVAERGLEVGPVPARAVIVAR